MKLELLSPAKDYQCAIDAINFGADAIYIGAIKFGARQNASNTIEDIEKIINYAHIFNVKVYVTINTILDDNELIEAVELIKKLYEIKTDAIIIQDFGLLELSNKNILPPIVLHMSTQADIRDIEKVKFFEQIGIKRVILARETPLNYIEKINKETNIELEHFIHGALCVSYSGQCYFSAYIGSRSANKGSCTQCCRKKYSLVNSNNKVLIKNKYLLSLKDNNLSNHLDKLIKAGVKSFKIEGRLKDSSYIRNTTLYYHNILSKYQRSSHGRIISDFEPDINKTFNRLYTDDYLFNKKDNIYNFTAPKSFGEFIGEVISSNEKSFIINTKKDISNSDGLCFVSNDELTGCLVNGFEKTKNGVKIFPNKKIFLKKGDKVYRNIDKKFNKTLENSKTTRKLDVYFKIYEDKIELKDENSIKVEYNLKDFDNAQNIEKMKENYNISLNKTGSSPFYTAKVEFLSDNIKFIPLSKLNEIKKTLFDDLVNKILKNYKPKKQKPVNYAKYPLSEGDYRLNVHNSKAEEFYKNCSCIVKERSFESSQNHKNKAIMLTRHCLKKISLGCNSNEDLFLVDEKGVKYPLKFDCKNCVMSVISP